MLKNRFLLAATALCIGTTLTLQGCDSGDGIKLAVENSANEFTVAALDPDLAAHYVAPPETLFGSHVPVSEVTVEGDPSEPVIGAALPETFNNWESPHVYPLDLTPDESRLLAVNTADARLEVFTFTNNLPVLADSIPVGLDPVTVRSRSNTEAWVVNHVSDSISIVNLTTGVVTHTLQTEDEPADVVFAGNPQRAFVTASQVNSVMVFDPNNLTAEPQTIEIAGEDPRGLAVSTDGNTVYAAIFESGNASTIVRGGRTSNDYRGVDSVNSPYAGQNPPPNSGNSTVPAMTPGLPTPPRVSMIVKKNSANQWMDDNNGDWTEMVSGSRSAESGRVQGWDMLDRDVAIINANSLDVTYQSSLMNMVMGISVNPSSGRVTVVGTDANNEVRFEPNLTSHFINVNFADFASAGGVARIRDMNDHLNPDVTFLSQAARQQSIGDPRSITWGPSGVAGYVTAMGSNSVIQINDNGSRRGSPTPIQVGSGPTASVLRVAGPNLLVLNRFGASISVVDIQARSEIAQVPFFDPTPDFVNQGRELLYDTQKFSGLGQVSCASCHVDARADRLAWDLGDPAGELLTINGFDFHPMKGPLRTTSLIGIVGAPTLHFRGDKATLVDFRPAYVGLQGLQTEPSVEEMLTLETFIATIKTPPNPFRNLDNTMPDILQIPGPEGRIGNPNNPSNNCSRCHNPDTNGRSGLRLGGNNSPGQQTTTAPSLKSMHEIMGLYLGRENASNAGFGFIGDGAMDPQASTTLRNNNSLALMMAFNGDAEGDTHAAVGTQVTLNGSQTAEDDATLAQLVSLATTQEIGLVAHGLRDNNRGRRGFTFLPDAGNFQTMEAGTTTSMDNLQSQATAAFPITFTAVPVGTEFRIGVDRDDDGLFDLEDPVTSAIPNPGTVPVNPPNPVLSDNLALTGTASQSTTDFGGVASRAIDGNTNGNYSAGSVTHSAPNSNAFWQVQLAQTSDINQIVIHNRTNNCCVSRLNNYTVEVIDDSGNTVFSQTYDSAPTPANSIDLDVTGRTVRVSLTGTLSLAEVEVFGTINNNPVDPIDPTDPVDPENLISNGNFSTNLSDWASCGGTADATSGVVTLSNNGCIFQEFNVMPGVQYSVSCDAAASEFTSLQLSTSDVSFATLAVDFTIVSGTTLAPITATVTAPDSSAQGVITLYSDNLGSFDNCVVTTDAAVSAPQPSTPEPTAPAASADNLLSNGDFTIGDTDWFTCGGSHTISSGNTLELAAGGCIFQEFAATPGETYEISCSASSADFASVTLLYSDSAFTSLATSESQVPGTSFSTVTASEIAPANTVRGVITLFADDTAVFDDCEAVEL